MRYKKDYPISFYHDDNAFGIYESHELLDPIYDAIEVLETKRFSSEEQMFEAIANKINDRRLAINLLRLVPIAYCRNIFSGHIFSDQYKVQLSEFEPDIFYFSKNRLFKEVNSVVAHRLMQEPKPTLNVIENVLTECADYKFIEAEIKGGRLQNPISLTPSYRN
jgi:hypothetical protein